MKAIILIIVGAALGWVVWSILEIRPDITHFSYPSVQSSAEAIKIPEKITAGKQTFQGVEYRRHDDAFLYFTHDSGVARVELQSLSRDIQLALGYDSEKAGERRSEAAFASRNAQSQLSAEKAIRNPPVDVADLVVLRGTARRLASGVMLVECDGPQPSIQEDVRDVHNQAGAGLVDARSGAADTAAAAQWAISARQSRSRDARTKSIPSHGPLKAVYDNALVNANSRPSVVVAGAVALIEYPEKAGPVNIVAAPTGVSFSGLPLYSARFHIVD